MMRSAILLSFLFLAACGFRPVYAPTQATGAAAGGGPVSIVEIDGRTGHFLRQELVRTLGQGVPGVSGESELTITLSESINRLAFAPDRSASRSDYRVTANWVLRDTGGRRLAGGRVREAASFNVANSPYADVAAQSAAQERVASLLARSIREQVLIEAGRTRTAATPAQRSTP